MLKLKLNNVNLKNCLKQNKKYFVEQVIRKKPKRINITKIKVQFNLHMDIIQIYKNNIVVH